MKVSAKCMNHSGCLKAYRGEIIELDPGAPLVCPECGKPLAKAGGGAGGTVKVLAIVVGVLVIAVGAVLGMKFMKKGGGSTAEAEPTPAAEMTPAPPSTSEPPPPTDTPAKTTAITPPAATPMAEPSSPAPADEPPPAQPMATNEEVTDQVRNEVLKRIDKMPNMLPEKKDRLYNAVGRTRDMRKVVEIGFSSGQAQMPASSGPQVKKLLESPELMKMRDNPDCVFVVLGFADAKGSESANLAISDKRAKSVVDFMENQCGVRSVTHAVAMGGTNLVDKNNAAKNRIAEIWAVLP